MKSDPILKIVFSQMMLLFNVNRIEFVRVEGMEVDAMVGWPDEGQPHYDPNEERQEISWHAQAEQLTQDVSMCIEFLARTSALRGDRIVIDEPQLLLRLMNSFGWDIERAKVALNALLSVRIDMIDEGSPTDAFFLHF